MDKVHTFQNVKGGSGCTTSAVGFGFWLAVSTGEKVEILTLTDDDDVTAIVAGNSASGRVTVTNGARLSNSEIIDKMIDHDIHSFLVIDAGLREISFPKDVNWTRHLVVRNDYTTLRRAVTGRNPDKEFDDFVLLFEKDSALSANDCNMVLRIPLFFSVDRNPQTHRAIDSGLFASGPQVYKYEPTLVQA